MIYKYLMLAFILGGQFLLPKTIHATSGHILRIGPATLGNGGSNPISGSPVDWQYVYVFKDSTEINLSISPGFFYGQRYKFSNDFHLALGPGLVLGANGGGFGGYAALSYDPSCKHSNWEFCFSAELTHAIGYVESGLTTPSAIRIGVSLWN
jgi:hypothetical protein